MTDALPTEASDLRPGLLEFLRCPECHSTLRGEPDVLLCSSCGHAMPVRGGIPFAFARSVMDEFLSLDEKRAQKSRRGRPSHARGGAYHWDTYRFDTLFPRLDGGRVLLHGCGDAGERAPVEALGFEAWGFDIKRTAGTDFLADAHTLPMADDSFDIVLSSQVLEHLHRPWTAAAEIARVLKPGGWFIGSVAFLKPYHTSYFHMSHEGVVHLLEPHGLVVDSFSGAQSITYSLYGGLLPFGSVAFRRRVYGFFDRVLFGARARLWSARRHTPADQPVDVFDSRFRFSFRDFDRLRYAPAVVFRARKGEAVT